MDIKTALASVDEIGFGMEPGQEFSVVANGKVDGKMYGAIHGNGVFLLDLVARVTARLATDAGMPVSAILDYITREVPKIQSEGK